MDDGCANAQHELEDALIVGVMGRAKGGQQATGFDSVFGARRGERERQPPLITDFADVALYNRLGELQAAVRASPLLTPDQIAALQPLGDRFERWSRGHDHLPIVALAVSADGAAFDTQMRERFGPAFVQRLLRECDTRNPIEDQPVHDWAKEVRRNTEAVILRNWLENDSTGESFILLAMEPPPAYAEMRRSLGLEPSQPTAGVLTNADVQRILTASESALMAGSFGADESAVRWWLLKSLREVLTEKASRSR